ncbi:hypothetical protein BTVI_86897 [Pitangus sulphuratus]|nr:hypothetical protein BTVI_86897 [Pitangus sulphuratus]
MEAQIRNWALYIPVILQEIAVTLFIARSGCTKSADAKETALDWAVKHSNLEMAEMVAKAGVDVNAKSASVALALCKFRENDNIPEVFIGV